MKTNFDLKQFVIITFITSIWIHLSEVFRYFVLVMPRVRSFFDGKSGVAEMNLGVFSIWGVWDTILTAILVFFFWLYAKSFGNNRRSIFISGTLVWLAVFVIFWIATANMGLSEWSILLITLPLSWIEMIVGTWIVSIVYKRKING